MLQTAASMLLRRGVKMTEEGTTIDLPPELIELSRMSYIFSKADWPGWMFAIQFVVIVATLIVSGIASYSIGHYMMLVLSVQANEDAPNAGYASLNQDEEEDGTNKRPDERAPAIVATTRIRQFFHQAKAATGQSCIRVLLRGARSYAAYAVVLGIFMNIADSCFLGSREGVDPTPSIEHLNTDLPFDLPGSTLMSFIGTFFAALLAKPFHAVWVFSVLRLSPEVGYFATLKSLPMKKLLAPAVIESGTVAAVRAISYFTFKYYMLSVANGIVTYDSETDPGAFNCAIVKATIVALLSAVVQCAIIIPATILLFRAEANALVDQPPQYSLTVGEENAGLKTIVKIFRKESVEELILSGRCRNRFGARLRQYLPCKTVKEVVIVSLKGLAVQLGIGFVAGFVIFGLTAVVAAMNPDLTW